MTALAGTNPDLRRIGLHPDFWAPVAQSRHLKPGKTMAVSFAGQPIVLGRSEEGKAFALEDRCAHRQVPLSRGLVCGETVKCSYHGWAYDASGRCIDVPYLGKGQTLPNGVRRYPCREAYGLLFIFPGDPEKAEGRFPAVPTWSDPDYKTRVLDREVRCHYSFMHENLMDMNHQFLHRSLMGGIRATLLALERGPDWVETVYTFSRVSGSQSWGERFMIKGSAGGAARREHDVMVIRTQYPYQTLRFVRRDQEKPALDLWLSYAPVDVAQRVNHSLGLMMIRKPSVPGLIHLFWPAIVLFTEGIFRQDRDIMELEQRAWDAQGGDWNQEVFPAIRMLREVLAANGVPL